MTQTQDQKLLQSLRDQQNSLLVKMAKLKQQRDSNGAKLAQLQQQRHEATPALINGHAEQAQQQLDKLDHEQRKLERTMAALDAELGQLQASYDALQTEANDVDIRIAQSARAAHRQELAGALAKQQQISARLTLELQASDKRCAELKGELFEIDRQMRDEQQRAMRKLSDEHWRATNPHAPGFERTRNWL